MSFSLAYLGVGFLVAWLGAIMLHISLKLESEERHGRRLNMYTTQIRNSRRHVKIALIIGILTTMVLYVASWFGILAW